MAPELDAWGKELASWAHEKPQISEVWLFGSRVRGDHRYDSDLDVALIMSGSDEETRLGNWIALASKWEQELAMLFEVEIDLDLGDADISTAVVAPALQAYGEKIFDRYEISCD